jgi:hypothetical protein
MRGGKSIGDAQVSSTEQQGLQAGENRLMLLTMIVGEKVERERKWFTFWNGGTN